jgi:transposase
VVHRRERCQSCQHDLSQIAGSVGERRQVHDLPALQLRVEEHQIEEVRCPVCGEMNRGSFPEDVNAPVQYGPRVQALCVYLSQFQLLPMERTCEMIADLCHCTLGEGTLANWIQEASKRLEPTIEQIKALLVKSLLNHTDETGIRIKGRLHWGHVSGTRWLTHYVWHRKRGKEAMDSIGILPAFKGRVMHDRWRSYDQYGSAHSLCGSHLLRDCLAVFEQEQQTWAQDMHDLLLMMVKATDYWREQGAKALPQSERNVWLALYFHILAMGYAKHPPPETQQLPQQKGKRKQSASKNLLDALLHRADQVLAFLDDLSLPFTNNLAERDLRMLKVQQKISGTFRSQEGATAFFNIRSYLSTMRKQGRSMLDAMMAVFSGTPFPVAWAGPE